MARERFVSVDRNTPMLLPPDLRDWIADDDLAHFVLEAVEGADLSKARVNRLRSGSEQYPPGMMLAVLIYCYATGTFGSRQIEQLTYRHLSVRYLAGNQHPDHDTICKFRRENGELLKTVFAHVLKMAAALKLGRLGTVCIDGTKILANAAKRRTFNAEELHKQEKLLEEKIGKLLAEAENADAQNTDDGMSLPEVLKGRQRLQEQMRQARELLSEQVRERAEDREIDRKAWKKEPIGSCPEVISPVPGKTARINLTDPQSALMPLARGGYGQGYNAQLAVSAELRGVIVAAEVTAQTNDRLQLLPMVVRSHESSPVSRVVVDTGYDNARQIAAIQKQLSIEVICSPQIAPPKERSRSARQTKARHASQKIRAELREKAQSDDGKEWLRMRRMTVEPIFGMIKSVLGFRGFLLRGLSKVNLEWQLVALAFNCRRISGLRSKVPR